MKIKQSIVTQFELDFEDTHYLMETMRILDKLEESLGKQVSKKLLNEYRDFIEQNDETFSSFILYLLSSEKSLIFNTD